MPLQDRTDSKGKAPSSLLPPEPQRPLFRRGPEQFSRQSPSSLLSETPAKSNRDPALDDTVAVSPSSLLPPEPQQPHLRRGPEQFPQHSPSSLLPQTPANANRDPASEDRVAISPSSLLPPEPQRPALRRGPEQLQQGPSSLLPEAPANANRDPASEDRVAVSPSSLLPDSTPAYRNLTRDALVAVSPSELLAAAPASRWSRWINGWTIGGAGALVLLVAVAIMFARVKPVPQLMQEAAVAANNGNHVAAIARFDNVLQRQPNHAEARFLLGRSHLALGNPTAAEAELRRALDAGWRKQDIQPELARAMLRQGKYQALLDEIVPDDADGAAQPGPTHALRGLAHLALGNENDARVAFEKSLSQSPENADALLGLARIAERAKRLDEADALVARALRANAGNADGWLLKGELQWR